jgi:hypothetical protein
MAEILGTIFFVALVYIAGSFTGKPLYAWLQQKMPWNK